MKLKSIRRVQCPLRFLNLEDAMLFMECMENQREFPKEKILYPFRIVGPLVIENKEYKDAPYELGLGELE